MPGPADPHDIQAEIDAALAQYEHDHPQAAAQTTDDDDWVREPPPEYYDEDTPAGVDRPEPERPDTEFWKARPTLTHIHDVARARRASPWAVLGAALCRVVTSVKPFVVLPPLIGGHASLNLFIALVGPSGSGKGASEAAADHAIDLPDHIHVSHAGSGEGIAHEYMRRTRQGLEQHNDAVLFSIPEIDSLAALGNRQGSTLMPQLRQAWVGERLGFGYADPAKKLPIPAHAYRMCLIAGVQPERAGALLDDAPAGTPQRLVWLPAADPDAPDMPPPCPDPIEWRRPALPTAEWGTNRTILPVCETARQTVDQNRLARLRGDGQALDGHVLLCRLKVAAALALLDGHADIQDTDWSLSGTVMAISDRTRADVERALLDVKKRANRGRAESEAERAIVVTERIEETSIRRIARGIGRRLRAEGRTPRAKLRKAVPSRDRPLFDAAVDSLIAAGQVNTVDLDRGTAYELAEGAT